MRIVSGPRAGDLIPWQRSSGAAYERRDLAGALSQKRKARTGLPILVEVHRDASVISAWKDDKIPDVGRGGRGSRD